MSLCSGSHMIACKTASTAPVSVLVLAIPVTLLEL